MVLAHTVLEAVLSVAILTRNSNSVQRIDIGLTQRMRALRSGRCCGLALRRPKGLGSSCGLTFRGRPSARFRTLVAGFSAMIETIGALAGFTTERKEIQLITVGELTVRAHQLYIFIHSGERL